MSTYPFDLVHDAFEENQIDHQFAYYSYLQETTPLQPFSPHHPLIYNLFGSERHKESMVISLDRLYEFIFGIMGVHQLPKLIEDKVRQASHLVFLGFSFDDWYMKLLLRVLKVHEKEISYTHFPGSARIGKGNQMFFESNFKITFLNKQVDEFVENLHKMCAKEELLRKGAGLQANSPYERLQMLNEQSRFEEVLSTLDEWIIEDGKEGGLLKELNTYQQTYHRLKELDNYDDISKEELEKAWRKLRNKLSVFIDLVSESISV